MKKHCVILVLLLSCGLPSLAYEGESVLSAMKRATKYMMEVASYEGGFVWSYLPDYSRQWGELEARRTMVWLQPPGTPAVGHLMLNAYHATTDEYYYQCAKKIADVLIKGQLPCGGWNYVFDLEGEEALKQWYATIGKQAWRLEEFQHYYGNATFDDGGTMQAAEFFLRMYLEEKTKSKDGNNRYEEPLNKAICFVLDSQYDNGGWPQRYPLMYDHPFRDMADYTSFITLNDDVIIDAIEFLQHCSEALHRPELKAAAERAMLLVARLQSSKVNNQKSTVEGRFSGWADQYTVNDLQPAHARSYEPRSINTGTTAKVVRLMLSYYRQTGNKVFLQGVPDA
ncbi:MAG: pectate lyase, partial [Bacteroidaceae bacterium]|nr:pectate lyase [Bacteroidaceae bacterium]